MFIQFKYSFIIIIIRIIAIIISIIINIITIHSFTHLFIYSFIQSIISLFLFLSSWIHFTRHLSLAQLNGHRNIKEFYFLFYN